MSGGWCTIESDPAVFHELISRFGVKNVDVEEVISMDEDSVAALGGSRIHGFILLYKYVPDPSEKNVITDSDLYFAKQVVHDACATQAIVNMLLNCRETVDIGAELATFGDFTVGLDPLTRGEMIGQSDLLRTAHNSFSRPACFSFEDKKRHRDEDPDQYHFVAYIFKNDIVWELDGLQPGPILIEPTDAASWVSVALSAMQSKLSTIAALDTKGAGRGISSALMAVCDSKIPGLEAKIAEAKAAGQLDAAAALEADLRELQDRQQKRTRENARRRHQYVGALVELFRCLAEKDALGAVIDEAKNRAEAKRAEKARRVRKPDSAAAS